MALTKKQREYVRLRVANPDWDKDTAAAKAGYLSPGAQVERNPEVKGALLAGATGFSRVADLTPESLIQSLLDLYDQAREEGPVYSDDLTEPEVIGHRNPDLKLAKEILERVGKWSKLNVWTEKHEVEAKGKAAIIGWATNGAVDLEDFLK